MTERMMDGKMAKVVQEVGKEHFRWTNGWEIGGEIGSSAVDANAAGWMLL